VRREPVGVRMIKLPPLRFVGLSDNISDLTGDVPGSNPPRDTGYHD
jgi:hypothetical protein